MLEGRSSTAPFGRFGSAESRRFWCETGAPGEGSVLRRPKRHAHRSVRAHVVSGNPCRGRIPRRNAQTRRRNHESGRRRLTIAKSHFARSAIFEPVFTRRRVCLTLWMSVRGRKKRKFLLRRNKLQAGNRLGNHVFLDLDQVGICRSHP